MRERRDDGQDERVANLREVHCMCVERHTNERTNERTGCLLETLALDRLGLLLLSVLSLCLSLSATARSAFFLWTRPFFTVLAPHETVYLASFLGAGASSSVVVDRALGSSSAVRDRRIG